MNNVIILTVKIGVVGYVGYKQWKSGGKWLPGVAKVCSDIIVKSARKFIQ